MKTKLKDERLSEHSIFTFTGQRFWPLQPRPDEVNLLDIAHALANSCRFTGHVKAFYSVAQHSVHVSNMVPPEQALAALLHDSPEAYLSDIASPVKAQMPQYKEIEAGLEKAIATAFNLPYLMSPEIKNVDKRLLITEKRDLLPRSGAFDKVHGGDLQPYDFVIVPLLPIQAKQLFLLRFAEITTGYVPGTCEAGACKTYAEDFLVDIAKQLADAK